MKLKLSQSWLMSLRCTFVLWRIFSLELCTGKGTVIAGLIQFFFYNGKYKYEQDFNKKLTISHTVEAKKAFNST